MFESLPTTNGREPAHQVTSAKTAPKGRSPRLGGLFESGRGWVAPGAFFLCAASFVAGGAFAKLAVAGDGPYDLVRQLGRVLVLIENQYVDPVDRSRLLEGAIKGMVSELDPHSSYMPPEDYRMFEADTKGEFGGVGVEVDFRNGGVVVIAPIEGSPAERAGIRSGDRIVAIDGTPVSGQSTQDLVRVMRGKPGTRVVVSVVRGPTDEVMHISLTREVIHVASIAGKLLAGDVAYVRIKQFQSGTHDEFLDAVGKLRQEAHGTFRGVLLDLRNDPGGLVDEASAVADEFLTSGVIYSTRHRGDIVDEVHAHGGGALHREPAVVLVNEYTASAAELLAGAMQDPKRATIVGARTFGKGSVQSVIDLPDGAGMRLTTMRYYTPAGHSIQAQGIVPDVVVAAGDPGPFGVRRESDLENHLAPEGPEAPPAAAVAPVESPDGGGISPIDVLGTTSAIPVDPTKGKDVALATAYRLVLGQRR